MSQAELLLKEIETLPASYMSEILDFVGYLKHKTPVAVKAEYHRLSAKEAVEKCWGIAQNSGLTSDCFLEMKRAELAIEQKKDVQRWNKQ
jgi:hypothetical protein